MHPKGHKRSFLKIIDGSLRLRVLVMYEGEIVGELDPAATDVQELGLYMAGAKRMKKEGEGA